MKRVKALIDLRFAKENLQKLLNGETGVTDIPSWDLHHMIDHTPQLTPEVRTEILRHLNTYINSWVLPRIDWAIEELENK